MDLAEVERWMSEFKPLPEMSKNYCIHFQHPPAGFGRRTKDGKRCNYSECKRLHEDAEGEDKAKAEHIKNYMVLVQMRNRLVGEGKGSGRNRAPGRAKSNTRGGERQETDPMQANDAWRQYSWDKSR